MLLFDVFSYLTKGMQILLLLLHQLMIRMSEPEKNMVSLQQEVVTGVEAANGREFDCSNCISQTVMQTDGCGRVIELHATTYFLLQQNRTERQAYRSGLLCHLFHA